MASRAAPPRIGFGYRFAVAHARQSASLNHVPIPLAICYGLLTGLVFARVTQGLLVRGTASPYLSPAFPIVVAFGLLVLGPLAGVCAAVSPDWTLCYLIDSQRVAGMLETLSVVVVAATVPAGYLWGALVTARKRQNALGRYLAVGAVLVFVVCMGMWKRMGVEATYAQFHGDFGIHPLAGSELGYVILWLLLILGLASTWTLFSLYKLGQQAPHGINYDE